MAYLALEKVEDEKMGEVLDSLKEQAQTITSTDLAKIRKPEKYEMVKNTHHWVEPSMEEIKACLESLEKKLLAYDSRIIQVASLGWEQSSQTREIINSYGMQEKMQTVCNTWLPVLLSKKTISLWTIMKLK